MSSISTHGIVRFVLASSFIIALLLGTGGFYLVLHERAVQHSATEAGRLLTTATAIRVYTDKHVAPQLQNLPADKFYEEMVPAFAAQTVYRSVQLMFPGYSYREPALNPTNPIDRPTPFEVELINRFRTEPNLHELQGVRDDPKGAVYYLARPIKITQEGCLVCHDTPQRAPAAMVAKYGRTNGFGWKLNETVGIQSLTVPAAEELHETGEIAMILGGGLLVVFIAIYFALTLSLDLMVTRPLQALAQAAEYASLRTEAATAIPQTGASEIRNIGSAIERLRISLSKAMKQLGGSPPAGS
jgi:protein-histidine pros-kinase